MQKTMAMKALEGAGVPYETFTYPASERDAVQVASYLKAPADQVLKTLVVTRQPGKPLLVMIPADRQLDLKKLAREVGEKKLVMASHTQAERLTGLQVGGISPLALLKRPFVPLIDYGAAEHEYVYVSAGKRGINLRVPVTGLADVTGAQWVDAT